MRIDPRELNALAAFATRGGIGTGVALTDCVAESPDQLMYIQGDDLILLRDLGRTYIASCEGVVGWVEKDHVRVVNGSELLSPATETTPSTILTAPSPPSQVLLLPPTVDETGSRNGALPKRISGPFELDSPQLSPPAGGVDGYFAEQQQQQLQREGQNQKEDKRDSIDSHTSSEAFGGIGGFMMGGGSEEGHKDGVEELIDVSPPTPSIVTPNEPPSDDEDWDIYGDYARESMYVPKRGSKSPLREVNRDSFEGGLYAARAVLEGRKEPETPKAVGRDPEATVNLVSPETTTTTTTTTTPGRSVATELRLRIQREREMAETPLVSLTKSMMVVETPSIPKPAFQVMEESFDEHPTPSGSDHRSYSSKSSPTSHSPSEPLESDESTIIKTPHAPNEVTFTAPSPVDKQFPETLLASPLPIDDSPAPKLFAPPPPTHSPRLSPNLAQRSWSPASPSSPHSVAATKQAVEAVRSTPEGSRPRGMTLVGRMDADLSAAKGPVPITFLVGGPGMPGVQPTTPTPRETIGLGLPSGMKSPGPYRRATSPLSPHPPVGPSESRFPTPPMPIRNNTAPLPPSPASGSSQTASASSTPQPNFFPPRPRSRSFSAAFARSSSKNRKDSAPSLSINTSPPVPLIESVRKRSIFGSRKDSMPPAIPTPISPPPRSSIQSSLSSASASTSTIHLPLSSDNSPTFTPPPVPLSARSSSFSFKSTNSSSSANRTPRKSSALALPSPVSHKDFAEETVKADGMDFELVQPKRQGSTILSPISVNGGGEEVVTLKSESSSTSLRAPLPETDEWGFLKEMSPTPEIFMSRSAGADHRAAEQKWLGIIGTPLAAGATPSKKVRKLAIEAGIPSSLRGKVWAWFMSGSMSARVPGLYQQLLAHDRGKFGDIIDRDVKSAYSDHSIFSSPNSPGQQDLRSLLRAYSNFAPTGYRPEMALLAGALLIHCVVEDAFWLLSGLVNGVLRDYWGVETWRLRVDAAVFSGVLQGSEPKIAKLFKDLGVDPILFLERWYTTLYIRCLPWPTMLRVMDALVSEGPRYLLVTSLTILTLSRDRLLSLPKTRHDILGYLMDLPQDSLLLPENFMRACENVKFRDEDLKKLRTAVEKEMNGGK